MKKLDVNIVNIMKGIIGGMLREEVARKYFISTEGVFFKIEQDYCSPIKFALLRDKESENILSYSTEYYSDNWKIRESAMKRYRMISDFEALREGYNEMIKLVRPKFRNELRAVIESTTLIFEGGYLKTQLLPPTKECLKKVSIKGTIKIQYEEDSKWIECEVVY